MTRKDLIDALEILNKAANAAWLCGEKHLAFSLARAFRYLISQRVGL